MAMSSVCFSSLPVDSIRSVIDYVSSSDRFVMFYTTPEIECDKTLLLLARVCKAWKIMVCEKLILCEELHRATTRLRAHFAYREATLLEQFPSSIVKIFRRHYIPIPKLPQFMVDQRTRPVGSTPVCINLGEVKHPVARYCLKDDRCPQGIHGLILKIQEIHSKIEATLIVFKPASSGIVTSAAYRWKDNNSSIQQLYRRRHLANVAEGHWTEYSPRRDGFGRPYTLCKKCPFGPFYVQPEVIMTLLNGQDPDFKLSGENA